MTNIIVVFPKIEEGKSIKNILVRSGFSSVIVCQNAAQAMQKADELRTGMVICGYKLPDMLCYQLKEDLPRDFEMLLVASAQLISQRSHADIVTVAMPLKVHDFVTTVNMMSEQLERKLRKKRTKPKERTSEELDVIKKAKRLLMDRNHLSEDEAHKYIQKCSMDSGTNIVETSQMVLAMF
ncbi:MAG: ANTAR domain-containing protein [Lachnospiraceae bacterium]